MDAIESSVQTDPSSQWIIIDDEMIKNIGYKTKSRKGNDRTALFKYIKKIYKKDTDYKLKNIKVTNQCGSGGHHKNTLEMTRSTYDDILLKTREFRTKKKKSETLHICIA